MKSLNDDDLTSLLNQAKANPPKPSPELTARTRRAYEEQFHSLPAWRRLLFGTVRVRLMVAFSVSVTLLVAGAVLGYLMSQPHDLMQRRSVADTSNRDRPVLNLYGLQPVPELHLRLVRRANEIR